MIKIKDFYPFQFLSAENFAVTAKYSCENQSNFHIFVQSNFLGTLCQFS